MEAMTKAEKKMAADRCVFGICKSKGLFGCGFRINLKASKYN